MRTTRREGMWGTMTLIEYDKDEDVPELFSDEKLRNLRVELTTKMAAAARTESDIVMFEKGIVKRQNQIREMRAQLANYRADIRKLARELHDATGGDH